MKITNRKISLFGVIATVLFNIVVLSNFNTLFVGSAYSFFYLSIIPGFFIQRLLRIRGISFFESIAYIVGLSISYLFLVGISTNLLVLLPHMPQPLNTTNSLIVFNIYIMILLLANYVRENKSLIYVTLSKVTFTQLFFYIIPFFFLILSIIGTQLLNNYGVNTLTMMLLFSIAVYAFLVTIFTKRLGKISYEIPIYLIAISLLFMFSLRSSYIIGWDVNLEYKVFLLTEMHQLWSMANYPDPYNACLSITILPTLFHYFTKIDNAYTFKILFQCIFALVPITIYSLAKKFANRLISFFSAFFFMSTLDFYREMPALVRQEIAFLFFGLLVLTLFNKQIKPLQKKILFVIFSSSIALSHYSTTYILIAIFGFTCICLIIYKKIDHKFYFFPKDYTLKPLPFFIFIVLSFIWFGVITGTSSNIVDAIIKTSANINAYDQQTLNTSLIAQLNPFAATPDRQVLFAQEIKDAEKNYSHLNFKYYPKTAYKNYIPTIIDQDKLPLQISNQLNNMINFFNVFVEITMKVLIILGFIGTIVLFRKRFFSAEYCILCIGFAIALIIITSVPTISLLYPLGRLDQQTLFLIALPAILSLFWLLRFIPSGFRGRWKNYAPDLHHSAGQSQNVMGTDPTKAALRRQFVKPGFIDVEKLDTIPLQHSHFIEHGKGRGAALLMRRAIFHATPCPYNIRMSLIAVLFITFFLFTNTFVYQLIGGQNPEVFLNNSGLYYNEIYLHPSELASIHWLYANNQEHLSVFADIGSTEKMIGYDGQQYTPTEMDVFPSLIDTNGLVYSGYANTLYSIGITNPKDTRMEYNFPNEFLNENKNLIYNNNYTRIFK